MKKKIRNSISYCIATLMISLGFVSRARRKFLNSENILTLCFHAPSKQFFESCMSWLQEKGFRFVSIQDVEKIAAGQMEFPKGAVLITVDDGWQSNLSNIVPVAVERKIPVTIFVSTAPAEEGTRYWWSWVKMANERGVSFRDVETYKFIPDAERLTLVNDLRKSMPDAREACTPEEIEQIANNGWITIGGHTHTHPILPMCSHEKMETEISLSTQKLNSWTGKPITYFAYPNGDFGEREKATLQKNGYKLAFSIVKVPVTPANISNTLELPRLMMFESASVKENICRMTGVWFRFIPTA
jgi:poly-beta-1,6-N-acetyl-D-glucosamine N-deacetylase